MSSAAAGAIGLALASSAIRVLVAFGPVNLPRLEEVRLDGLVRIGRFGAGDQRVADGAADDISFARGFTSIGLETRFAELIKAGTAA